MRGGSTIWQPAAACLCISERNCRSSLLKWLIVSAAETFWSPLGCNNAHSFKNKAQNDTQHCECKQLFLCIKESPHIFIKVSNISVSDAELDNLCYIMVVTFLWAGSVWPCQQLTEVPLTHTAARSWVAAERCIAPTSSPHRSHTAPWGGPIICRGSVYSPPLWKYSIVHPGTLFIYNYTATQIFFWLTRYIGGCISFAFSAFIMHI